MTEIGFLCSVIPVAACATFGCILGIYTGGKYLFMSPEALWDRQTRSSNVVRQPKAEQDQWISMMERVRHWYGGVYDDIPQPKDKNVLLEPWKSAEGERY